MWRLLAMALNNLSGRALYSQREIWTIQVNLPAVMRSLPRYTVHAIGRLGQMEMYDAWTQEHGVMLNCGVWLPGAWIDSAGHTDGPIDPGDTWMEA